jgi:exopolyphosphatase/pppGpp-phosphohydrolase
MNLSILKVKEKICYLLSLLFVFSMQAQSIYGGIEIGGKGIKMSVIDVKNIKKGIYEVEDFWTENAGIASGISIDGNLGEEDINIASNIVADNYKKMISKFRIEEKNIFIVASSGVGMAKNTEALVKKIKLLTNKKLNIVSSSLEARLLLKGCIPPKNYRNSMILDIGGGNTKGGYIDDINGRIFFSPLNLDIGTVTLTEKINEKNKLRPRDEFNEVFFDYQTVLRKDFSKMYATRPELVKKNNFYLSGGAVWAFYILFNHKEAEENFSEINYNDVLSLKFIVENNFRQIELLALTNKDVRKVLGTYSQKNLISGCNLLMIALEEIPDVNSKKIFFAKQGQIAWLVSYIVDNSRGVDPVF